MKPLKNQENDEHMLWIKYFTANWKKNVKIEAANDELKEILKIIPSPVFKPISTDNNQSNLKNESTLVERFLLDDPIPQAYLELVNLIQRNQVSKEMQSSLSSLLLQYVIILVHQSLRAFKGVLEEKEHSEKTISRLFPLFSIFSANLELPVNNFITFVQPIYKFLIKSLQEETYFPNSEFGAIMNEQILKSTLIFISLKETLQNESISGCFDYLKLYLNYFANVNNKMIWKRSALSNILVIYEYIIKVDKNIFSHFDLNFLKGFVDISFDLFEFAVFSAGDTTSKKLVFNTFIKFLGFLAKCEIREDARAYISNSEKAEFIPRLIIWSINNFQFLNGDFDSKRETEENTYFDTHNFTVDLENKLIKDEKYNFKEAFENYEKIIYDITNKQEYFPKFKCMILIDYIGDILSFKNTLNLAISIICPLLEKFIANEYSMNFTFSLLFFILEIFDKIDYTYGFQILKVSKVLQKFFNGCAFSPNILLFDKDDKEMKIIYSVRVSLLCTIRKLFINNIDSRSTICNALLSLINSKRMDIVKYLLAFQEAVARTNEEAVPSFFQDGIFVSQISNFLLSLDLKGKYKKHANEVAKVCFKCFHYFITPNSPNCIYFCTSKGFCQALKRFIFHSNLQEDAVVIITNLLITKYKKDNNDPYEYIIDVVSELIDTFIENTGNDDYFNLLEQSLSIILPAISDNIILTFNSIMRNNLLVKVSKLVKGKDKNETMRRFKMVMTFFMQTMIQYPPMKKIVTEQPMEIITKIVKENLIINTDVINMYLTHIFGGKIDINESQKEYVISNAKILPFLHEITKGTVTHLNLFTFFYNICKKSLTNRLQICHSKMPTTIIEYITSFETIESISPLEKECINTLNDLLIIVLSVETKKNTIFKAISSMKISEGKYRNWWTNLFISALTRIVQNTSKMNVKSFFSCQTNTKGLYVPPFKEGIIGKKFTIMTRIRLSDIDSSKKSILTIASTDVTTSLFVSKEGVSVSIASESSTYEENSKTKLDANEWYLVSFVSDDQEIKIYFNNTKVIDFEYNLSMTNNISISVLKHVSGSINVLYIFCQAFDNAMISFFAALPNSFCLPLTNDDLKETNFANSVVRSTVSCYNAVMSIDCMCKNIGSKFIGEAEADCLIVKNANTLTDIINSMGGAKIFLPLLDQVNLQLKEGKTQMFLSTLLSFFAEILKYDFVADEFTSTNGFYCMSSFLEGINVENITKYDIQLIVDIYSNLSNKNKPSMLIAIFLNINMWRNLPVYCYNIILNCVLNEIENNFEVIKECLSINILLTKSRIEDNKDIRKFIWQLIAEYAKHKLTEQDIDNMLALGNSSDDVDYKIELFNCLLAIIENDPSKTMRVIKDYTKFLTLFENTNDTISLISLKIFSIITRSQGEGSLDKLLCTLIKRGKTTSFTKSIVLEIIKTIKETNIIDIAYIFIALTTCMNKDVILLFANKLNEIPKIGVLLMQLRSWYIWLTNLLFSADEEVDLMSADYDPIAKLYGSVLAEFVLELNSSAISDFIGFFTYIQANFKIDTPVFIRRIYSYMFSILTKEPVMQEQKIITLEVLGYLFFIPETEVYYTNVQLNNLKDPHQTKTKMKLHQMLTSKAKVVVPAFQFSARINEKGEWLDNQLAIWLIQYYILAPFKSSTMIWFVEAHFYMSDLCAYLAGFIARASHKDISWSVSTMIVIMGMSPNDSSFYIFVSNLIHAVNDAPNHFDQLYNFFSKYSKYLPKDMKFNTIEDVFSNAEFLDLCCKYSMPFLESIASLKDDNRFDRLYERRNRRIVEVINFFNHHYEDAPQENNMKTIEPEKLEDKSLMLSSFCKDMKKNLMNTLLRNGGPWSCNATNDQSLYWKLSMTFDNKLRRIIAKQNYKFDPNSKEIRDRLVVCEPNQHHSEDILSIDVNLVTISKTFSGKFIINNSNEIAFNSPKEKNISFNGNSISMILRRFYLHEDRGMEFFLTKRKSYLFVFNSVHDRESVTKIVKTKLATNHMIFNQGDVPYDTFFKQTKITQKWVDGKISNFEYLMLINIFSGRSFNDVTQYPIFPWVLKDYESETIDLNNPNVYRDFSKPIVAQNENKLKKIIERDPNNFVYLFSYSNPYSVLHFMVRIEPFTAAHINYQNGFDNVDRAFKSIKDEWEKINTIDSYSVELTPEFFYLPDFLYNRDKYDVGGDVAMPEWAKNPEDFISFMHEALESKYVSEHINEWIDIIFGCNQRGENAKELYNVYMDEFYLDYPIEDEMGAAIAKTSGVIPYQLFKTQHPKRTTIPYTPKFNSIEDAKLVKLSDYKSQVIFIASLDNSLVLITNDLRVFHGSKMISKLYFEGTPQFMLYKDTLITITDNQNKVKFYKLGATLKFVNSLFFSNGITSKLISAGENAIVMLRDSSINIIDIINRTIIATYSPHFATISFIDSCCDAPISASVDKNNKVLISNIFSGKLIHYFDVEEADYRGISMINAENVVLRKERSISLFSLDGTAINTYISGEVITYIISGDLHSGSQFICFITSSGKITVLSVPELKVICSVQHVCPISLIYYMKDVCTFVVSDVSGSVFSFQLK